jgi:hypothetical protein
MKKSSSLTEMGKGANGAKGAVEIEEYVSSDTDSPSENPPETSPPQDVYSDRDVQTSILAVLQNYPEGIKLWLLKETLVGVLGEQVERCLASLCHTGEVYEPRKETYYLRE